MTIQIKVVKTLKFPGWDRLVERSNSGTVFHKLRFLQYHPKGKFHFYNIAFYYKGRIVAVLPGMLDENNIFKSPAGASYGSFAIENPTLARYEAIVNAFLTHARENEFKEIILTPPPIIYQKNQNEIERFLLEYKGFKVKYNLISNVASLKNITYKKLPESYSTMHRRAIKKSFKLGVRTEFNERFDEFYPILLDNKKKFNTNPTHTLEEIYRLKTLLPKNIKLIMAYDKESNPIGGILVFLCNKRVVLTFYIAHYYKYQRFRAVNRLFHETMAWAKKNKYAYVDLGVSMDTSSTDPMEPSRNLVFFKEGIKSRGFLRTTYHYKL